MVDPIATPLINVGLALTSMLLNAAQQSEAAAIASEARDPISLLAQSLLGRRGTRKDIERRISKDLTSRMHDMNERCSREGIDPDRLANPCAEVEDILRAIDDHARLLEQAVHDPDAVRALFEEQARSSRIQIDEQLVPYFDELIKAVVDQYIDYAERSPNYLHVAAKQSLKNDKEHSEAHAKDLDAHAVTHDKLDTLSSKFDMMTCPANTPNRILFGSRPEVVTGDRYIERDEHEHLKALIADPTQRRTVLVGMRGCGKTQLAAALAHTCEEAQWSLVAWLNAGSRAQLDGEFVELARKLKIDLSDEPDQEQIVGRCIEHLRDADASDRLIVLDNVVDIEDLRDRIPMGAGLRVVATTTSREYDWEENGWKGISVGVFSREESINYLLTVTGSQDRDTADAIAERLGDLPLAIAQAAATAHNEQWTLASYARRLEFSCGEKVISRIRGHYYSYAVSVALWMATDSTLERLDDPLSDAARRQLGALCLLAESGVPTRWLDPAAVSALSGCHDAELDSAVERAHRALIALINASIIRQSADGNTVTLHRLHAQVLRESWNNNEHDEARAAAADLLGSVDISRYPSNDTKARRQEALDLVDQLRSIGTQEYSQVLFEYPQIIRSLSQAFSHASDLGLPYEALTLDVAVDSLEGLLGPDHPDTLASRNNLAGAYKSAGHLTEAIALYEQVLTDHIRVLDEDHPDTLASRNNLAGAYKSAGRLTEAIALYKHVIADCTRVLGDDHPSTLTSRDNLASAYKSAGRLTEAIALYEQVLTDRTRVLGEDHPHTLASRNNLAGAYQAAGRLTEAITLYEQVLPDSIRVLGEDHPHTLASRHNLAGAYASDGNLPEAIVRWQALCADCLHMLGPDHPLTVTVRENLEAARRELAQQEDDSAAE